MELWLVITISVAAAILVAGLAWLLYERKRTQRLRDRFGPEYDRTVSTVGNRRRAESEMEQRETRARELRSRPLSISDRERFLVEWKLCQAQFVDDPAGAVEHADRLVCEVMRTRGYSPDDPYNRIADISAAYPDSAGAYRDADAIVARNRNGQVVSTDDLRSAFIHYREVFDEMLGGYDEERKRA